MNSWKIIKSDYLLRSQWLTLRVDKCETEQGISIDPYYVLEFPDWVQIVVFDANNRILITKQYRHASGETCVEIPCGEMEKNESPMAAANRELQEETGYASDNFEELCCLYPNPARQNNRLYCFMAFNCKKVAKPRRDKSEVVEYSFVDIKTLMNLIDSGSFTHALHIAGILIALRKRKLQS